MEGPWVAGAGRSVRALSPPGCNIDKRHRKTIYGDQQRSTRALIGYFSHVLSLGTKGIRGGVCLPGWGGGSTSVKLRVWGVGMS